MKEDSNLNEKLWLPLRSIMQWNVNPIVTLIVIVPVFIITFILAIILAMYEGIRLAIEDEKQLKKNEEKVYANKAKENILVKINFPKYIYVIGSIAVILSLFWFYTSTWVKSSYNQVWVIILTLSAFLTAVNVHYLSKPKGTLFNKIARTITITGLLFTVGVFPLSMSIAGIIILAIFNQGAYSRLTEPFGIGWLCVSIIVFLFQIPKIIDFNAIKINHLYSKGDKLYDQKRYEEAIAEYNKAFELEGAENFYYYYAVGLAYKDMGNNKQAKQMLNKALSIQDYPECYYALADNCLESNDYKTGLDYIDKLLNKLDKDSKDYKECEQFKADYLNKKEIFDNERRSNRAKELYEQATRYKNFSEYGKAKKSIKQAIELAPDNESYKTLLQDIQNLYNEEKAKVDDIYNTAVCLKDEHKYKKALKTIENGIDSAKKQDISIDNFEKLKKEVSKFVSDLKEAEEKYNTALKLYNDKEYSNAVFNMERAVSLAPDNVEYKDKLQEIKQTWNNSKTSAEEFYFEAKNCLQNNDLNNALSNINSALNLITDSKYSSLKTDIERELQQEKNKQEAEKLYTEAERLYNSNNINYDRIVDLLDSANKKYPTAQYQDFLKKIKSEWNTIQAENLYQKAKKDFDNKNYESATSYIDEAVKLSPSNRVYLDLKQKISWDRNKYESDLYAEKSYKTGVKAYNDGDFTNAVDNLTKACNVKPDNEEWQKVLEKAKTGKIDIMYCSKKGLLTLDFIDDNIAEQIIKSRNDGNMWYGYEEFAQAFSFQPHQYPDIEEKIAFPLKQGNKYGRRLDV